jgi:transposase
MKEALMKITTLGIDLAKRVFHVHGVDERGNAVFEKKLMRDQVLPFMEKLEPCVVGIEACGGAHYWAREIGKRGHQVKMMAPQFVKPYVKGNKDDRADAAAICEAVSRPSMRFVPVKTTAQQDIQMIHRVRSRLVKGRTALSNEIRGLLGEYGIIIPKSIAALRKKLPGILEQGTGLSPQTSQMFQDLLEELEEMDEKIKAQDKRLRAVCKDSDVCRRLLTVPGIGYITATALHAAAGEACVFENGRQMAAWIGLVPKHVGTGGRNRMLGISKRGNSYLRSLLVHGARSVHKSSLRKQREERDSASGGASGTQTEGNHNSVPAAADGIGGFRKWVCDLDERRGSCRSTVAIANKLARYAWAVMRSGEEFDPNRYETIRARAQAANRHIPAA